ncbi:MAG: hypothetical protein RIT14_1253 [Pseudomonadota bacterium]|jgi:DNA-binding response OmpR family regulator
MSDAGSLVQTSERTIRVLVVEDEDNVALALEYVIRREGYDFMRISDGADAEGALVEQRPDIVLIDVMLPNVSGYEICKMVRDRAELRDTRVIIMTARGSSLQRERAMLAGADDFLPKPFSLEDLRSKLKVQRAAR